MTTHRPVLDRRPARTVSVTIVVALVAALIPLWVMTGATVAHAATRLDVALSAHFADAQARPDRIGSVAGVASPSWQPGGTVTNSPTLPFAFTAACDAAGPCTAGDTVSWDFGDGTTTGGSGMLATTHAYTTTGVYTARVRVFNTDSSGEATIRVLVAPRFTDADAALAGKPARPDAEAIWAVTALGLVQPCRTYLGGNAYDARTDAQTTDPGRTEFCPEPNPQLNPTTTSSGAALALPAAAATNPVTGANCLSSWTACGLPAQVFADNSANAGSATNGDPTSPCGSACRQILTSTGKIDGSGNLLWDPTNCLDNYAATRSSGDWTVTTGVGYGCVSRGEFFSALVKAVDGAATGSTTLTHAAATVCTDGAGGGPTGDAMLRAAALLGTDTVLRTRSGKTYCDTNAALTKEEAYLAVGKAAGMPAGDPSRLRDLTDITLGHGTKTTNPNGAQDAALFTLAGPLVGSSTCVDHAGGACFNGGEALTRASEATLLAALLIGRPALASGLQVAVTTPTPTTPAGHTVQLRATVTAPAYYAPTAAVTVGWPTPTGDDHSDCPATQQATVGVNHQVTVTCTYTPAHRGTLSLPVTVTDANGNSVTGVVNLTVTNTPPAIGTENLPTANEGASATATISARDAEGNPITYSVRSCQPGDGCPTSTPTTYPQTGATPTTTWGSSANVEVGTISVAPAAAGADNGVTVTVTPADSYANGTYEAVLRACDQDDCATRVLQGTLTPVNTPPVTPALITATTRDAQLTVTLSGSDPHDNGRGGCTSTIAQYRIDTLPAAGTLLVQRADGSYTAAVVGDTTTSATTQWQPPAASGTWGFTYDVLDTGCPGPGVWSTTPGQVQLTNNSSADNPPTAALTVSPVTAPAQTGTVTADASGSADTDGTPIASYTFDWGDGTTTGPQAGAVATHVYSPAQTTSYTVTVTVTDTVGNSSTATGTVTVAQNLAANPTLDAGTTGYSPTGPASLTATTNAPHNGQQAMTVTATSAGGAGYTPTTNPVAATTTAPYTATVWVRPDAADVGKAYTLTITELSSSGTTVSSSATTVTLAAGWQKVTVAYTPTATGNALTFSGQLPGAASGASFDVDDISLTN